jgi:hypothetical protein
MTPREDAAVTMLACLVLAVCIGGFAYGLLDFARWCAGRGRDREGSAR